MNNEEEKSAGRAPRLVNLGTLLWPGKELLRMMGMTTPRPSHSQPPPAHTNQPTISVASECYHVAKITNIHTNNNTRKVFTFQNVSYVVITAILMSREQLNGWRKKLESVMEWVCVKAHGWCGGCQPTEPLSVASV